MALIHSISVDETKLSRQTERMTELEAHLLQKTAEALEAVSNASPSEIYAFYLVCSLDENGGYRPYIDSLAWLEETRRAAVKDEYGNEFSGWGATGKAILSGCYEERDPRGFALQTEFFRGQLKTDSERKRFALYEKLWPVRWAEDKISPSDWDAAQTMLASIGVPENDRKYLSSVMLRLVPFDLSEAFFEPLGNVLRELQRSGLIERKCGRTVPVGLLATNDVAYKWGFEPTQFANSRDLARNVRVDAR